MEELKTQESKNTTSIKEFFKRFKQETSDSIPISNPIPFNEFLWRAEYDYFRSNLAQDNSVLIEIDILYNETPQHEINKSSNLKISELQEERKNQENSSSLGIYKHSARVYLPKEKISGTFIEDELKKGEEDDHSTKCEKNYMKIELKAKRNKIMLESIIDCFEYIVDRNYEIHYNKENLISYFYAFSLCKLFDKRKEVLERLLLDLSDDNIIYFLKVVSNIEDDFLSSYSFWLLRYLINNIQKGDKIKFNGYDFETIIKISPGVYFTFDPNRIIINSNKLSWNLTANLLFLRKYYESHRSEIEKYFKVNNHFNMGRVLRRKTDDNFGLDDYPHYYQLLLENDPNIVLFALRVSENSNFIISRSYDDFSKYGMNFVAEIVPNFWGTHFDVYDFGYEKSLYESTPKVLSHPRKSIVNMILS